MARACRAQCHGWGCCTGRSQSAVGVAAVAVASRVLRYALSQSWYELKLTDPANSQGVGFPTAARVRDSCKPGRHVAKNGQRTGQVGWPASSADQVIGVEARLVGPQTLDRPTDSSSLAAGVCLLRNAPQSRPGRDSGRSYRVGGHADPASQPLAKRCEIMRMPVPRVSHKAPKRRAQGLGVVDELWGRGWERTRAAEWKPTTVIALDANGSGPLGRANRAPANATIAVTVPHVRPCVSAKTLHLPSILKSSSWKSCLRFSAKVIMSPATAECTAVTGDRADAI
eukprot:CAMPEP_0185192022 /NCGR_PEP_ID=MMETSP1140-20130426/17710_1 /TAXON_ID=298111 /ORGANISM="Pavlova sp., Strain CCMP459" /LENGTH=283 /DNA_ID=CAMNT_0027758751 /DNA_START=77 /DNA_END=930 /DNA_ORIENTATION=-